MFATVGWFKIQLVNFILIGYGISLVGEYSASASVADVQGLSAQAVACCL